MSPLRGAWYDFIQWLVRNTFFRLYGGLKAKGKVNVPKQGPLIVAPVHLSHTDPPAVACTVGRRLRFLAKEELFKVPIFGPLISSVGAYPIRRGEGDTEAIRVTLDFLEKGEAVLVFPEGTRGDGVTMNPMNKGVALLAKRSGAAVLPVGIVGTHRLLPKGASKPRRSRTTIAYGKPIKFSDFENREEFSAALEAAILALCEENGLPIKSASMNTAPAASHAR